MSRYTEYLQTNEHGMAQIKTHTIPVPLYDVGWWVSWKDTTNPNEKPKEGIVRGYQIFVDDIGDEKITDIDATIQYMVDTEHSNSLEVVNEEFIFEYIESEGSTE